MNLFLESFQKKQKTTPIWIMRQAGRYLPEYLNIRKNFSDFFEFCNSVPEIVEVTLQPIKRFDLDAAIIFSDILVIPKALGYDVKFIENKGPVVTGNILEKDADLEIKLANVYRSIKQVRSELSKDKALIGFAGAPWTLACYIFGRDKKFMDVKKLAYNDDKHFYEIMDILTIKVYEHLKNQIKNGADCVKIFDSWAGCLDQKFLHKLSFGPILKIYNWLKKDYPDIPIIIFPKDTASHNLNFNPDCLAISYSENLDEVIKNTGKDVVLQGNLDPIYLELDNKSTIKQEVRRIMDLMRDRKHIFNLGHGVNPSAKIENIQYLIELIRGGNYE